MKQHPQPQAPVSDLEQRPPHDPNEGGPWEAWCRLCGDDLDKDIAGEWTHVREADAFHGGHDPVPHIDGQVGGDSVGS